MKRKVCLLPGKDTSEPAKKKRRSGSHGSGSPSRIPRRKALLAALSAHCSDDVAGCPDGTSRCSFFGVAGETYLIRVGGKFGTGVGEMVAVGIGEPDGVAAPVGAGPDDGFAMETSGQPTLLFDVNVLGKLSGFSERQTSRMIALMRDESVSKSLTDIV